MTLVNSQPQSTQRLLMIDDDVELGKLLMEYLARFGFRLVIASTGAEGRRALRRDGAQPSQLA